MVLSCLKILNFIYSAKLREYTNWSQKKEKKKLNSYGQSAFSKFATLRRAAQGVPSLVSPLSPCFRVESVFQSLTENNHKKIYSSGVTAREPHFLYDAIGNSSKPSFPAKREI